MKILLQSWYICCCSVLILKSVATPPIYNKLLQSSHLVDSINVYHILNVCIKCLQGHQATQLDRPSENRILIIQIERVYKIPLVFHKVDKNISWCSYLMSQHIENALVVCTWSNVSHPTWFVSHKSSIPFFGQYFQQHYWKFPFHLHVPYHSLLS